MPSGGVALPICCLPSLLRETMPHALLH